MNSADATSLAEQICRFIRYDDSVADFEQWLYSQYENAVIENLLGKEVLFSALETDFRDRHEVYRLRKQLRARLDAVIPWKCRCRYWRDQEKLVIGFDPESDNTLPLDGFLSRFSLISRQTPWLLSVCCSNCGQYWYIAVDTIDDDYHLQRITAEEAEATKTGVWSSTFDRLEAVWPSLEWLKLYGYSSLEEWQSTNAP